jgi:hypothetical protein
MRVDGANPQARCCLPVSGNFGNMKMSGVRRAETFALPIQEDLDVNLDAA